MGYSRPTTTEIRSRAPKPRTVSWVTRVIGLTSRHCGRPIRRRDALARCSPVDRRCRGWTWCASISLTGSVASTACAAGETANRRAFPTKPHWSSTDSR